MVAPVTVRLPKVPTLVILGCAAVVMVPPNVVPVIAPEADTELGVMAPNDRVIVGVVVGFATVPLTPFAVVTETDVTVPAPDMVAQVLSPLRYVEAEGVPLAERLAMPTIPFASVPL